MPSETRITEPTRKRRRGLTSSARGANKRTPPPRNLSLGVEPDETALSPASGETDVDSLLLTTQGPLKSAEYALLGFARIYIGDTTLERRLGSPQRPLCAAHVRKLAGLMGERNIGVRRVEHANRIILSCSRSAITTWENEHGAKLSRDNITELIDFYETTNHYFEVQDGQHRLAALQLLVDTIAEKKGADCSWKRRQLWWTAYIFDSDAIDIWDLELLRMNVSSHHKPDTQADVWVKLDSMQAHAKAVDSESTLKQKWQELETRVLALTTVTKRFKEIYDGRWAPTVRRLLRYPAYHHTFYSNALARVNVQRTRFFWKQFFQELEDLLESITSGRPEVLTVESLDALRTIKLPRSAEKTEQVYGMELGSREALSRGTFLSQLNDDEYRASAVYLSSSSIRVALSTWDEIAKLGTHFADVVDCVCYHICRWIEPTSLQEGQSCRDKMSVEEVWERALPPGTPDPAVAAESFGKSVIAAVRRSEKTLRKSQNRPYLEKESIDHDTHTYRERFSCPAWLDILDLTEEVFGTLGHPHVNKFESSGEVETPPGDPTVAMAQTLTRTVKRSYQVGPFNQVAYHDLQGRLAVVLNRWGVSWTQKSATGERPKTAEAGLPIHLVVSASQPCHSTAILPSLLGGGMIDDLGDCFSHSGARHTPGYDPENTPPAQVDPLSDRGDDTDLTFSPDRIVETQLGLVAELTGLEFDPMVLLSDHLTIADLNIAVDDIGNFLVASPNADLPELAFGLGPEWLDPFRMSSDLNISNAEGPTGSPSDFSELLVL